MRDRENRRLLQEAAQKCRDDGVQSNLTRRRFVAAAACSTAICALGGSRGAFAEITYSSRPASAGAPVWSQIPNQVWEVGKAVYLDLAEYVSDPDGDPISFSLDLPLPEGVSLQGSVISGTPIAETVTRVFTATADDGTPDLLQPKPPSSLTAQ